MSKNETPQPGTIESTPVTHSQSTEPGYGLASESMEKCGDIVKEFKQANITFSDAILTIQNIFNETVAQAGSLSRGPEYDKGLATYFDMLREASTENRQAVERGRRSTSQNDASRQDLFIPQEEVNIQRNNPVLGNEDFETSTNKRKHIEDDCFPWASSSDALRRSIGPELLRTLDILDKWSTDPKFIRSKILLAVGCPDFPPDQWLNVVQGNVVDLDKVLAAHYSTDTDQKQTQEMGLFQFSLKMANTSRFVKSQADWSIAHYKYVRAIAFALPWMRDSIQTYHDFILQTFAAFHPSAHSHVIAFDRAVRLRVAHQKYIGLDDVSKFDDLRNIHLNPYGADLKVEIQAQPEEEKVSDMEIAELPVINGIKESKEFENFQALRTIRENPHLFKVSTPVDVDLSKAFYLRIQIQVSFKVFGLGYERVFGPLRRGVGAHAAH
ncbi:hypothetical protein BJ138DRAFT_1179310 [Hygrophoropsis aurantiaca]|uniref:Uncharacterized protein n=1 Tax=Hygrophoropsis aurantiaca TaxID=72124 RepID=A0ACB8AEA4_9AGAM|nr:hypothetical protein BJ138DRAFT_1179310 [Hygrophoropsis aurantiaca]